MIGKDPLYSSNVVTLSELVILWCVLSAAGEFVMSIFSLLFALFANKNNVRTSNLFLSKSKIC